MIPFRCKKIKCEHRSFIRRNDIIDLMLDALRESNNDLHKSQKDPIDEEVSKVQCTHI